MRELRIIAAVFFLAVLSACGGSSGVTPETATVSPATADLLTGQTQAFTTNVNKDPGKITWAVNGTTGGDSTVGTIDANGNYTAPAAQLATPATVSATSNSNSAITASAAVTVVGTGAVTGSANPQVATYTIAPPVAAGVTIQFGLDTTYGLTTSSQTSGGAGASLATLVAGMLPKTTYHMRAMLAMPDGTQLADADHTFNSGSLPAGQTPAITAATPNGMTPQPGVELSSYVSVGTLPSATATDLSGNVLWWYKTGGTNQNLIQPIKLLPNGHFVAVIAPTSTWSENPAPPPAGTLDLVREFDLAGNTIREITLDQLNTALATAGYNYTALTIHHDIAILPNGHWIIMVNSAVPYTDLPGHKGTFDILGDALVDLDTNLKPVWFWNTFDHLDVSREPYLFPDWTHANAVLYSPTDGNLLMSIRHQSWIIKIDYADGAGAGDVLWKLGYQGDFTLQGGSDPVDWFSAEHGPAFTTTTTAGTFGLSVFDNGNVRQYPAGESCTSVGAPLCPNYSTAQVLTIDETAMTATVSFIDKLPTYSSFGGNAQVLPNGNMEYDLCQVPPAIPASTAVYEVTQDTPAQAVWSQSTAAVNAYRAFRMGSLYPGVQW